MGLKASLNLIKPIISKAKYVKPEIKVLSQNMEAGSLETFADRFTGLLESSLIFKQIKQSILTHAPLDKQEMILSTYNEFAKKTSDVKVIEQLYNGILTEFKNIKSSRDLKRLNIAWGCDCSQLSEAELTKIYNKIFKNIKLLREKNPQEYEIMVKGGFFDLVEQGKISSYNFATDFKNARISRSLLNDLKKIANHEEFIPDYTNFSLSQIKKTVQEGEVYLKNGKLFTQNNGLEVELQLSKEKFEELFPPILRHISNQGFLANCWLIGKLDNLMSSTSGKGGIYSLFRESGKDIYIRFPNCDKGILFPNGRVLQSAKNKQINAVPGLAILEQASAVHFGNKYSSGTITKITDFNVDNLMEILVGHKSCLRKNSFEITEISNEYLDYINMQKPYNSYRATSDVSLLEDMCDGFGIKLSQTKNKNLEIMRRIIEHQANNTNLKINAGFRKNTPSEYVELYNIVPNHKLTIQSVENNSVWISNPWYNWIEKQVPNDIFYKYLDNIEVPVQWV